MATGEQHLGFGEHQIRQRQAENNLGFAGRTWRSVKNFIKNHPAEASLLPTILASYFGFDYLTEGPLRQALFGRAVQAGSLTPSLEGNRSNRLAEFTAVPSVRAVIEEPTPGIVDATATATSTATAESTATASPTATLSPTETPRPKAGFESNDQNIVYRTDKQEILNVPQIEGLKTELLSAKDNKEKIIYKTLETNKYGLEANIYAGEYISNVKMTGEDGKEKQTGGVVLTALVVRQLINEKLATIPNQRDRWITVLPVDPRGLDKNDNVSVKFEKAAIGKLIATMRFQGKAPLVNNFPGSTQLRIMAGGTYGGGYLDPIRLMDPYADKIFPGKEMQYFTVAGNLEGFSENTTIKSSFGEKVGLGGSLVIVGHSAAYETDDTTADKILSIGGIPVFLAANGANNEFKVLADGSIDFGNGVIGPSKTDQN